MGLLSKLLGKEGNINMPEDDNTIGAGAAGSSVTASAPTTPADAALAAPAPTPASAPAAPTTLPIADVKGFIRELISDPDFQAVVTAPQTRTAEEIRKLKQRQLEQDGKWEEVARMRAEDNARLQRQINQSSFASSAATHLSQRLGIPITEAAALAQSIPYADGDVSSVCDNFVNTNRSLVDLALAGVAARRTSTQTAAPAAPTQTAAANRDQIFPAGASGSTGQMPARTEPGPIDVRNMTPDEYRKYKEERLGRPGQNVLGMRRRAS